MKSCTLLVSIIIVHYKVKKELFDCIKSIYASKPKTAFEIIVVENDPTADIEKDLQKEYKDVLYIKSHKNTGWGGGTNFGAKHARGEYLFFLNPDTLFVTPVLDSLYTFAKKTSNVGFVSAILTDKTGNPEHLASARELTPLYALFVFSFINKYFPNNLVAQRYFYQSWDRKGIKQVFTVPLSAALIKKSVFAELGGLDEHFFLYFEEYDFSKRIHKKGLHNYIDANAKVFHAVGKSTNSLGSTLPYYIQSRQYYFQKHYGSFWASVVNFFLSVKISR